LERWGGGIVGNGADHFAFVAVEANAAGVVGGDGESSQDQGGALEVDGVAGDGVDGFHERGLDAFLVFDEGHGMDARSGRGGDAVDHALVEVAETLAAEGGRAAGVSGNLDVGAGFDAGTDWHGF